MLKHEKYSEKNTHCAVEQPVEQWLCEQRLSIQTIPKMNQEPTAFQEMLCASRSFKSTDFEVHNEWNALSGERNCNDEGTGIL